MMMSKIKHPIFIAVIKFKKTKMVAFSNAQNPGGSLLILTLQTE